MNEIDPRAMVASSARIGPGTRVSAFAVVGDGVELGDDCVLEPHAVVRGPARIGRKNIFDSFCSVGGDPQDLKFSGERTELVVGDGNRFREFSTVSRGTTQGGGVTRIGSHNLFMAYSHVAHDCVVGSHTVFANGATLAGHVIIDDYANVGAFSPCTSSAAWAATLTSALAPSSRRTCRLFRAWSPSARRIAMA